MLWRHFMHSIRQCQTDYYYGNSLEVTVSGDQLKPRTTAECPRPVVKFRAEKFEPFAEVLFGGAHSSFYGNLCKQLATCVDNNPSNNAFDFVLGGGLDIPLSHSIAFRPVQVDYVLTRFGNGFTSGNQNQSNFRYQAGIQFRF